MAMEPQSQNVWQLGYHKDDFQLSPFVVRTLGWIVLFVNVVYIGMDGAVFLRTSGFLSYADFAKWLFLTALAISVIGIIAGTFCIRGHSSGRSLAIIWAWCQMVVIAVTVCANIFMIRPSGFTFTTYSAFAIQSLRNAAPAATLLFLFWNRSTNNSVGHQASRPANLGIDQTNMLDKSSYLLLPIGIIVLLVNFLGLGSNFLTTFAYYHRPPSAFDSRKSLAYGSYAIDSICIAMGLMGAIAGVEMIRRDPRCVAFGVFWARCWLGNSLFLVCLYSWIWTSLYPKLGLTMPWYTEVVYLGRMVVSAWLAALLLLLFRHPELRQAAPTNL
ncbi:MAG: hypothetical protein M3O30_15445 [Planctomycetota bacterium]|nr:hypothetical protein [Planctomycetota bacterium]